MNNSLENNKKNAFFERGSRPVSVEEVANAFGITIDKGEVSPLLTDVELMQDEGHFPMLVLTYQSRVSIGLTFYNHSDDWFVQEIKDLDRQNTMEVLHQQPYWKSEKPKFAEEIVQADKLARDSHDLFLTIRQRVVRSRHRITTEQRSGIILSDDDFIGKLLKVQPKEHGELQIFETIE